MSDYWYENRNKLDPGDVCELEDGRIVKLDRRVPGDGTDWYVLDRHQFLIGSGEFSWSDNDSRIHPCEIKRGPEW